jgi:hypothetical protein
MDVDYCQAVDVARILGKPDNYFTEDTTPSLNQIRSYIKSAEDHINRETRRSWKEVKISKEYYDIPTNIGYDLSTGVPVYLKNRFIKDFDVEQGDKIEVWVGSDYEDWLTDKVENRSQDFWLDNTMGILYLRMRYKILVGKALRLTYRYGEEEVPYDIQEITAMIVAKRIILNDDRSIMLQETGDPTRMSYDARLSKWDRIVNKTIEDYRELRAI